MLLAISPRRVTGRTRRCTRTGGSIGLEVNVRRARRVNFVVRAIESSYSYSYSYSYSNGAIMTEPIFDHEKLDVYQLSIGETTSASVFAIWVDDTMLVIFATLLSVSVSRQPGSEELTIDHVVPRAQGGESRWDNCVLACLTCNHRKVDRTPQQAKLRLRKQPAQPKWNPPGTDA